ncbi:MAG: hypothetical protein ACR2N3_17785 [Pyrinomonadaceae bacterium]
MSTIITKEVIKAEIEKIPDEKLEEFFAVVKEFSEPKKESLMAKLRKIKIQAPPDFSQNIDLYLSGEKTIE